MLRFVLFVSESQWGECDYSKKATVKLKSSTVVHWTTSKFKGDSRAHADSCPPHLLWAWWEQRIIKLLTTLGKRQEWLDMSQSNNYHFLHSRCNDLRCDFDYKGVKLGSHRWTLLRTLLLMNRCGLVQRWAACSGVSPCSNYLLSLFASVVSRLIDVVCIVKQRNQIVDEKHKLITHIPTQAEAAPCRKSAAEMQGAVLSHRWRYPWFLPLVLQWHLGGPTEISTAFYVCSVSGS